jgi:hypothetical protein
MYLKITNPGICHPEAFTILGLSTARGDDNKIGQFGSGAKMGILTCLRHGINPVVISGNMKVTFDCIGKKMGEKSFDQVVAIINGQKHELGFALEFGALDWTNLHYGLREFVSNALDQGDCKLSLVNSVPEVEEHGTTSLYIEYTDDVKLFHEQVGEYFLKFSGENFVIGDNNTNKLLVYKQGVLIRRTEEKALFRYNLEQIRLDESRNAEAHAVKMYAAFALRNLTLEQMSKLLKAFINGVSCFETSLDLDYMTGGVFSIMMKKAFFENFGENASIVTPQYYQYCSKKLANIVVVNDLCFRLLRNCDIPVSTVEGGKVGVENGFMPITTSSDCKRIFNKIWRKIESLGLHNNKEKPELAMFSKPMDSGSTIGGYYEDGVVYIERNHVNAKVILEEIGHHVTGAHDATRDFQDWAFNVSGALIMK